MRPKETRQIMPKGPGKPIFHWVCAAILALTGCEIFNGARDDHVESTARNENAKGAIAVEAFLESANLSKLLETENESKIAFPKGVFKGTDYINSPAMVSGRLDFIYFSSSTPYESEKAKDFIWPLRKAQGAGKVDRAKIYRSAPFDLNRKNEVTDALFGRPEKIGFGIFKSLVVGFTYLDIDFEYDNERYSIRLCPSDRDGCTRGDILLRDRDGRYKWISKSGDPNALLPVRPLDPVVDREMAKEEWLSTGIRRTHAEVREEDYFNVPSDSGIYNIFLDFNLKNTVVLEGVLGRAHTRRAVLESFDSRCFISGAGSRTSLRVKPIIEWQNGKRPFRVRPSIPDLGKISPSFRKSRK